MDVLENAHNYSPDWLWSRQYPLGKHQQCPYLRNERLTSPDLPVQSSLQSSFAAPQSRSPLVCNHHSLKQQHRAVAASILAGLFAQPPHPHDPLANHLNVDSSASQHNPIDERNFSLHLNSFDVCIFAY